MTLKLRSLLAGAAVCALIYANACTLHAATIIKLNLGNVGPDLHMTGAGILGTESDSVAATDGDQNTDIEYTGFLEPLADVNSAIASFSLSGLQRIGSVISASPVIQTFAGGTLSLYDSSNTLLLSGLLTTSSLTGTAGPPGTGGLFSTNVASVTGGTLADFIVAGSLSVSMNLTNVNSGSGFSVNADLFLNEFNADTAVTISGDATPLGDGLPEPGTFVLATIAAFVGTAVRRRSVIV